ncbi:uncharacterized protein LOC126355567 [Schistocerca gregaria]|uniref:uncharacterized protein LOC126355567 n=1 Tax=Schistocerca gregaria TaxID=7010 RepID=UPI00211ED177|nr:uncharacterized protein LOC126355567 [Schistocerca gregaria]
MDMADRRSDEPARSTAPSGPSLMTTGDAAESFVRLQVANTGEYIKVRSEASNQGLYWFTHAAVPERLLKKVVKGFPKAAEPELLRDDLVERAFSVRNVKRAKSHVTHKESPSLLVIATDTPENRRLYQQERVANTTGTVENLRQKRGLVQCFRCQGMGHVARHCSFPEACVKSGNTPAATCNSDAPSQGPAHAMQEGELAAAVSAVSAVIDMATHLADSLQRAAEALLSATPAAAH